MATLFKHIKPTPQKTDRRHYTWSSILATVGFILSPLSWWNDMVVNVPLAYAFSIPFTLLHEKLFLPAFLLGYWLTNLLGFILMHRGVVGLVSTQPKKLALWRHVLVALSYTVIIVVMVWLEWIPMPTTLLNGLQ